MNIKQRLKKLEQVANQTETVDIAAGLLAARAATLSGIPVVRTPTPTEREHPRDPLARKIYVARKRAGLF